MPLLFESMLRAEWVRFVLLPLLAWFLTSLILYGVVGGKWWRRQGQNYANSAFDIERPLSFSQLLIGLLDIVAPVAIMLWFALHH
jgi:hypothetical protein